MKALDTNVLVRYLVQDDPIQAELANKFVQRQELLFIGEIVLCELIWVLDSVYGYSKQNLTFVLEKILLTEEFEVENKQEVWLALADFHRSKADFPDCLIGRRRQASGCLTTVTFDRKLKDLETFEPLS